MATITEIKTILQNLTKAKITQITIANALGCGRSNISQRENNNSVLTFEEIKKIENYFNVSLDNYKQELNNDIIKIQYWNGLPPELKNPDFSCVTAEYKVITHHWGLEPENLCIIPMVGDKMTNYWYPIKNGDILIINTAQNYILGNGVYFATSRNNTRYWIREMQILVNDNIELKGFSPSGNTTRILSPEEADEVDFKIIGKVIKNVSFKL